MTQIRPTDDRWLTGRVLSLYHIGSPGERQSCCVDRARVVDWNSFENVRYTHDARTIVVHVHESFPTRFCNASNVPYRRRRNRKGVVAFSLPVYDLK